jgi:hypothetical protein
MRNAAHSDRFRKCTTKPPRADAFPLPAFKNPIKSTYMLNTPHIPME